MDDHYVTRFLNLTTLALEIVAMMLGETLADLSLNPAEGVSLNTVAA